MPTVEVYLTKNVRTIEKIIGIIHKNYHSVTTLSSNQTREIWRQSTRTCTILYIQLRILHHILPTFLPTKSVKMHHSLLGILCHNFGFDKCSRDLTWTTYPQLYTYTNRYWVIQNHTISYHLSGTQLQLIYKPGIFPAKCLALSSFKIHHKLFNDIHQTIRNHFYTWGPWTFIRYKRTILVFHD